MPRLMGHTSTRAVAFLLLLLVSSACRQQPATVPLSAAELARIEALAQSCLLCHGPRELQRGPSLNGLPAWYIEQQLTKFAKGARGQNPANRSELLMGSTRDQYADPKTRRLLANYFAQQLPLPYQPVVQGDPARGRELYAACIPCHGAEGVGIEDLQSPPLILQEDWYLIDQMRKYQADLRGYHPDDPTGQQMRLAIKPVAPADLPHLTAYLQQLNLRSSPTP